jgi:hypothetical protein
LTIFDGFWKICKSHNIDWLSPCHKNRSSLILFNDVIIFCRYKQATMSLPLDSSFTLHPSGNQIDNAGAASRVLQMRQEDEHNEMRFIKRRLFHETASSAVRVTPFEPLVHRRNLPTTGAIRSASHYHSNPQQAPTHQHQHHQRHYHYQQYPSRYPTQEERQRAAFEPPITSSSSSTRDLHKRRCIQLHYAYNHSRQQMREMKQDQRQMKARIAELEDQLLRAQSRNRNQRFTDTDSLSSRSTIKTRSTSSVLCLVSKDENENASNLLASAAAAVTRRESSEQEEQEQKPPAIVTVRKDGGVKLFFTDSEALSEEEGGDDEDIVDDDDEDDIEIDESSYGDRKRTLTPRTCCQEQHAHAHTHPHTHPLHKEGRAGFPVPLLPQATIPCMTMVSRAVSFPDEATNTNTEQALPKKRKLA